MVKTLGGVMITHDAIRYDYCLEAALRSLLDLCDQVVVLDAESTDDTPQLLKSLQREFSHLEVIQGKWECLPDFHRLAELTNQAIDRIRTDWVFSLQADEVIHEFSYSIIRDVINASPYDAVTCSRFNIWRTFDTYIRPEFPRKPVSHYVVRLGKSQLSRAYDDAESLCGGNGIAQDYRDLIMIFHYGFMRHRDLMIRKVVDMQTWFGFGVDERILKQREETGLFHPDDFIPDYQVALKCLQHPHPKYVQKWVAERREEYASW